MQTRTSGLHQDSSQERKGKEVRLWVHAVEEPLGCPGALELRWERKAPKGWDLNIWENKGVSAEICKDIWETEFSLGHASCDRFTSI